MGAWIEITGTQTIIQGGKSLPLWERGLKCTNPDINFKTEMSLPLWERGLKCQETEGSSYRFGSLPLWERGLKSLSGNLNTTDLQAWIEI